VQERQEHETDGDFDAVVARLREELGDATTDLPLPPPPAPPPTRLGLLRIRGSVAVWRFRAALPEPVKTPLRRLLRRPAPAELAEPAGPSDLVRSVEELQVGQVELARRMSELENEIAAVKRRGKRRAETTPPER
jgi:hypothetical protein